MSIYLMYGEESYLLESRIKKIKKEFGNMIAGINYIQIDETNVSQLISDLETPAFGFDKKMIIAKNTGLFKKEKKSASKTTKTKKDDKKETKKKEQNKNISLQEKIADYLQNNINEINQTTELIFVEQEAEKNELYKTIEKNGEVKEFSFLKLPELISNLRKIASAYKVNLDDGTAKYLVECSRN